MATMACCYYQKSRIWTRHVDISVVNPLHTCSKSEDVFVYLLHTTNIHRHIIMKSNLWQGKRTQQKLNSPFAQTLFGHDFASWYSCVRWTSYKSFRKIICYGFCDNRTILRRSSSTLSYLLLETTFT